MLRTIGLIYFILQALSAISQFDKVDLTNELIQPKHYIITKTNAQLKIDGVASENAWKNAVFTDPFIDIEGKKVVPYRTQVKMLWDDDFIYFYAELEEPHIWGNLRQRDTIIYFNNDFEIFIDPSGDTKNYGEIEINALNTVWDLFLDQPYRVGGKPNFYWNLPELKSAVKIHGTRNDSRDIDKMWSLELAVPLNALIQLKNKPKIPPKEGEVWRINFSRVEWDHDIKNGVYDRKKVEGKFNREHNWVWSNQGVINMHEPEKWGYLQFTEAESAENIELIQQEDEIYIQALYAIYRKVLRGELSHLKSLGNEDRIIIRAKIAEDEVKDISFYKTHSGYEIGITSTESNIHYWINPNGDLSYTEKHKKEEFTFATWAHGDQVFDYDKWNKKLNEYRALGITEVLIGGSPEFLQELVNLASFKGIKIHAWMWTLNRPNDSTCMQHPEWYSVNRNGQNSLEYNAYVDYYQWLSPFHPEAREYVKSNVYKLTKIDGLASIHLDYVRYVDVILGAALQPKYDLVQDKEMPEYDYGYHPIARDSFKSIFGYDPLDIEFPEYSAEWRQFRLNALTSLVNECIDLAHHEGFKMTAAVFPYPEMSRHMVRQAWDDWNLDAAYPMLYQNFYNEGISWIGFATYIDVSKVDFPILAGLYIPGITSAKDLEEAIRLAHSNGASGVSIFQADNLSDEQKLVLPNLKAEFSQ